MLRQGEPRQAMPPSSGNEQSGSPESLRKPSLAIVCKPGRVLPNKQFQRRLAFGPRCHVEGGIPSERVLFLFGRRCGPGEGLSVCLNTEDKQEGIERSLPIIEEAVDAGRLTAWVADKAGKVETRRTERPRVDWSKLAAEVIRLAALVPADCGVEIGAAARRLGHRPGMLDLFVKFVRDQQCRWDRAPRFMRWARGAGSHRILNSNVVLSGGSPLDRRLNTNDSEVAAQRLRLLLWHAVEQGLLPGGEKHPAWREYGGPIARQTKDLLRRLRKTPWEKYKLECKAAAEQLGYCEATLDWLTNHEEDSRHDPERRAKCNATKRSYGRKTGKKQTPKSRSWQFSRVGAMLHVHSKGRPIYARVTIDRVTLVWLLPAQTRAEGEALVKPAVEARARASEAARIWRDCPVGSREAATALEACCDAQRLYFQALRGAGAESADGWADFARSVLEPPWDAGAQSKPRRVAMVRAKKKCLEFMKADARQNPDRPPHPHREYANRMRRRIPGLKHREFEECWRGILAMPNVKWGGTGGRPKSYP
jgi:hypothetical protein